MKRAVVLFVALSSILAVPIFFINGILSEPSLTKADYKYSVATEFAPAAMLALKRATGDVGAPYIEGISGPPNPSGLPVWKDVAEPGTLLEQQSSWTPGGKKIGGIFADLKEQEVREDDRQKLLRKVNAELPAGYHGSIFSRKLDDGSIHRAIIVQKVYVVFDDAKKH